jgi:protein-S-isoprenylcysteine O-methyltransferase Ste14
MKMKDHPAVYIPPPLIYAAIFVGAVFLQKIIVIKDSFFKKQLAWFAGIIFLAIAIYFIVRSLHQFIRTKNTVLTIKAAGSLQTTGIYNTTRNPMYVGLVMLYLGLTCFLGNWWNIILLPLLLIIIQRHVIHREERYLTRRFGAEYISYKLKVRRWL